MFDKSGAALMCSESFNYFSTYDTGPPVLRFIGLVFKYVLIVPSFVYYINLFKVRNFLLLHRYNVVC